MQVPTFEMLEQYSPENPPRLSISFHNIRAEWYLWQQLADVSYQPQSFQHFVFYCLLPIVVHVLGFPHSGFAKLRDTFYNTQPDLVFLAYHIQHIFYSRYGECLSVHKNKVCPDKPIVRLIKLFDEGVLNILAGDHTQRSFYYQRDEYQNVHVDKAYPDRWIDHPLEPLDEGSLSKNGNLSCGGPWSAVEG